MFDFKICGMKTKKNQIKNCYRFEVKFMHGDADKFETLFYYFPLGFHKAMQEAYEIINSGIGVDRDIFESIVHEKLTTWNETYASELIEAKNKMNLVDDDLNDSFGEFQIPGDCTCDFQYLAEPQNIDVVYFDDVGEKHSVKVVEVKDKSKCKHGKD